MIQLHAYYEELKKYVTRMIKMYQKGETIQAIHPFVEPMVTMKATIIRPEPDYDSYIVQFEGEDEFYRVMDYEIVPC